MKREKGPERTRVPAPEEHALHPQDNASAAGAGDAIVLVVDDDIVHRTFIAEELDDLDVTVVAVESGLKALEVASDHDIAVFIMDVVMPDMDGFELAKRLRSDSKTSNAPIVFISGNKTDDEDVLQGFQTGAIDYLIKPIDTEILKKKIQYYISQYNVQKALNLKSEKLEQAMVQVRRFKSDIRGDSHENFARKGTQNTSDTLQNTADMPSYSRIKQQIDINNDACPVPLLNSLQIESIRAKQRSEGYFDCFGRATEGYCDQLNCEYHLICINISTRVTQD